MLTKSGRNLQGGGQDNGTVWGHRDGVPKSKEGRGNSVFKGGKGGQTKGGEKRVWPE